MSRRFVLRLRWLALGLLSGGILFQASPCSSALATGTAGLLTSVSNEFIRNIVYKSMGIDTTGFGGLGMGT